MTLGDKIRKYRTLKGLTQAQLGSMVKLTGDRIRQYENDVRKPKDGKLFEIADALDINPSTLAEPDFDLSLIHISEPTRPRLISYAVFCLKKKRI